jgi:hypothetical protein
MFENFQDIQTGSELSVRRERIGGAWRWLYCRRHGGTVYVQCHCLHLLHYGTHNYLTGVCFGSHLQRPAP